MSFIALWLATQAVGGDAVIRGKTEDSEIVITTTSRCAGAIHSLRWRGHEFIDLYDHGRQLQSASNFDLGTPISGETFNPTEAGSRRDGTGDHSTSRLISIDARGNHLATTTQMAFWLAPGERSGQNLAKNTTTLSNHILRKDVSIGWHGRSHVIAYDVVFVVPRYEPHRAGVFESLTGYMPAEFRRFWRFDRATKTLQPLSDGPGEQPDPVVLATDDGQFAMGIYSASPSRKGYGRWWFAAEKVVKWNCVFRVDHPNLGGEYRFNHFVIVGTLEQVRQELALLQR